MQHYTNRNVAAIVGGTMAAGGATALLIRDAWTTGLTVDLALMPVLVGLTILAGHLFGSALRSGRIVSAVGLLVLALLGSGLTIYETMGRRAEIRDAKVAAAAGAADKRVHLTQMLREAEEALATHRRTKDAECASGRGKLCKAAEYTVSTWEHAVTGYETRLAQLPPPVPVDPRADRVAAIAGFLGATVDVPKVVSVVEPLMFPLFLELGSIILFGYGLGRSVPAQKVAAPAVAIIEEETLPSPAEIEEAKRYFVTEAESLADIQREVTAGRHHGVTGYAERWSVSVSEASKRIAALEECGAITCQRTGNQKLVVGIKPVMRVAAA